MSIQSSGAILIAGEIAGISCSSATPLIQVTSPAVTVRSLKVTSAQLKGVLLDIQPAKQTTLVGAQFVEGTTLVVDDVTLQSSTCWSAVASHHFETVTVSFVTLR